MISRVIHETVPKRMHTFQLNASARKIRDGDFKMEQHCERNSVDGIVRFKIRFYNKADRTMFCFYVLKSTFFNVSFKSQVRRIRIITESELTKIFFSV